jgi:hypothetical protein
MPEQEATLTTVRQDYEVAAGVDPIYGGEVPLWRDSVSYPSEAAFLTRDPVAEQAAMMTRYAAWLEQRHAPAHTEPGPEPPQE